jgi:hypothetical protein
MNLLKHKKFLLALIFALGIALVVISTLPKLSSSSKKDKSGFTKMTHSEYKDHAQKLLGVKASSFDSIKEQEDSNHNSYVRTYPIYELTRSDYALLSFSMIDVKKLESAMKSIRSSHKEISEEDSHFYESTYWNLNKAPSNSKEYNSFINENRIQILRKITEGIKSDDLKKVQIHIAAMEVINFYSAFDLIGFDDKNTPIAVLKKETFALMQKKP